MDKLTDKALPIDEVEFVLIGAGLPRTGTMSTHAALEILLPGRCHHMVRVFKDPTSRNSVHWLEAVEGKVTDSDWKEFVKDEKLSASVDYPSSLFWPDLVRIYPKAKVLLTVRDPVNWFNSVRNSIYQMVSIRTHPVKAPTLAVIDALMGRKRIPGERVPAAVCRAVTPVGEEFPGGIFGVVEEGVDEAVRFFNAWNDKVIKEVPSDRLLVFEVKKGWDPLCKFLNLPVPDLPFPNVNDTPSVVKRIRSMNSMCYIAWTATTAGLAVIAYCLI